MNPCKIGLGLFSLTLLSLLTSHRGWSVEVVCVNSLTYSPSLARGCTHAGECNESEHQYICDEGLFTVSDGSPTELATELHVHGPVRGRFNNAVAVNRGILRGLLLRRPGLPGCRDASCVRLCLDSLPVAPGAATYGEVRALLNITGAPVSPPRSCPYVEGIPTLPRGVVQSANVVVAHLIDCSQDFASGPSAIPAELRREHGELLPVDNEGSRETFTATLRECGVDILAGAHEAYAAFVHMIPPTTSLTPSEIRERFTECWTSPHCRTCVTHPNLPQCQLRSAPYSRAYPHDPVLDQILSSVQTYVHRAYGGANRGGIAEVVTAPEPLFSQIAEDILGPNIAQRIAEYADHHVERWACLNERGKQQLLCKALGSLLALEAPLRAPQMARGLFRRTRSAFRSLGPIVAGSAEARAIESQLVSAPVETGRAWEPPSIDTAAPATSARRVYSIAERARIILAARLRGISLRPDQFIENELVYTPRRGRALLHDSANPRDFNPYVGYVNGRAVGVNNPNKYLGLFRRLRDRGFSVIDLESRAQIRIAEEYAAEMRAAYPSERGVVFDYEFMDQNPEIDMETFVAFDRHRIEAAEALEMPIVVRLR